MASQVRLTPNTLLGLTHLRNMDTSQSASEDHYIRTNEDTSYSILQIHPVFPDLLLAVKQSALEFYNAGTLAKAEGVAAEDLYTFRITLATFLPGGIPTGTSSSPQARTAEEDPIVIFACDWKLEKAIFAYSVARRDIVAKFTGHEEPVTTLVASPARGASTFVSGSYEGSVMLWGPTGEQGKIGVLAKYRVPESDSGPVCAFDWSGRIFVACSGLRVFFFSVEHPGTPFKKLELTGRGRGIVDVCVSPHAKGDLTALRMSTGEVVVIESVQTYRVIATVEDELLRDLGKGGMSFSSDGLTLLIPSSKTLAVSLAPLFETKRDAPLTLHPIVLPLREEGPVVARFLPGAAALITGGDTIGVYRFKE